MNTKNIFFAFFLGLSAVNSYGNTQQLETELMAKQEQLTLLSNRIAEQEEVINFVIQKSRELGVAIREKKKNKLAAANPTKKILDDEITQAFHDEIVQFGKASVDPKNRKEKYILSNTFFGNDQDAYDEESAIFKFYLTRHIMEYGLLHLLLEKWETLKQELFDLYLQLDEVKENSKN